MKLQRFVSEFNEGDSLIRIADGEIINQLKNVFRFGVGDDLIITNGKGVEAVCKIVSIGKDIAELRVSEMKKTDILPRKSILYCAILKKENFELVVQKAVEVGISEIFPVISERTVKLNLNYERLRKIVKEAVEQSGRTTLPVLHEAVDFASAISGAKEFINIFFDERGGDANSISAPKGEVISAWIGPEGGWSEKEISLAKESGFKISTLGKNTLRGETAAIIASYLISNS